MGIFSLWIFGKVLSLGAVGLICLRYGFFCVRYCVCALVYGVLYYLIEGFHMIGCIE